VKLFRRNFSLQQFKSRSEASVQQKDAENKDYFLTETQRHREIKKKKASVNSVAL
jgi:hypothetical protein